MNVPGVFWVTWGPCRWQPEALLFGVTLQGCRKAFYSDQSVKMCVRADRGKQTDPPGTHRPTRHPQVYQVATDPPGTQTHQVPTDSLGTHRPTRYPQTHQAPQTHNCGVPDCSAAGSLSRCWRWRSGAAVSWQTSARPAAENCGRLQAARCAARLQISAGCDVNVVWDVFWQSAEGRLQGRTLCCQALLYILKRELIKIVNRNAEDCGC